MKKKKTYLIADSSATKEEGKMVGCRKGRRGRQVILQNCG